MFFLTAEIVWLWPSKKPHRRETACGFSDFDMPIEMAIDHIVNSTHHSFTRPSLDEDNAIEQLHKAMCSGRLAVIGKRGEASISPRISPRRCRRLEGREVATRHGMRVHLAEGKLLKRITEEIRELRGVIRALRAERSVRIQRTACPQ